MNSRFMRKKAYLRPRDRDVEYDCESYHLLTIDGNDSDAENSHQEKPFNLRPKRPASQYIEHTLQAGETLSSLALRYNCSVAEIKQANNILRENEVFALRTVRIPVPAFSLLRDNVPGVHSPNPNSKKNSEQNLSRIVQSPDSNFSNCSFKEEVRICSSDEELHNPLLTPLPPPRVPLIDLSDSEPPDLNLVQPTIVPKRTDGILQFSGADCGISWIALVVCMLILGFLGPLIYIFFLYEHEQELKEHNHSDSTVKSKAP